MYPEYPNLYQRARKATRLTQEEAAERIGVQIAGRGPCGRPGSAPEMPWAGAQPGHQATRQQQPGADHSADRRRVEPRPRLRDQQHRTGHRDEVTCEIVPAAGADAEAVLASAAEEIRAGLRFNAEVRAVDELPGDEGILVDARNWD